MLERIQRGSVLSKAVFMMKSDGPSIKSANGAVPKRYAGLRAGWMFILGILILSSYALAAPGTKPASVPAEKQAAASDFVGSETCATCHDEVSKGFASNPHQKMALMHGNSGITCENCHGAGKAHVDGGGDVTKIFNPAKAPAKQVDAKCLSCHAGAHPNFDRSPHAKAGVSCVSCHSVHQSEDKEQLLKASQPGLCFQCHNDVKPSGSGAMYNTLVNIHSGPRVLGQTFTMHALHRHQASLMDSPHGVQQWLWRRSEQLRQAGLLQGQAYEFHGIFRRDRQYFDYDLLGNPSSRRGSSVPYGMAAGVRRPASLAWPQQRNRR
jgi:predicted CXXCH cytochrome family protein